MVWATQNPYGSFAKPVTAADVIVTSRSKMLHYVPRAADGVQVIVDTGSEHSMSGYRGRVSFFNAE